MTCGSLHPRLIHFHESKRYSDIAEPMRPGKAGCSNRERLAPNGRERASNPETIARAASRLSTTMVGPGIYQVAISKYDRQATADEITKIVVIAAGRLQRVWSTDRLDRAG
jgi:hypothetical protein